jgi:hypothetical protein
MNKTVLLDSFIADSIKEVSAFAKCDIMIHNVTTERGIIGLTPPSRAEGTARGSERSGGPRAVPKARGGALNL